jgi:hypothetical protein
MSEAPDRWGGSPERTDESVVRLVVSEIGRGSVERYLEPGDEVEARNPESSKVTAVALGGDSGEEGGSS